MMSNIANFTLHTLSPTDATRTFQQEFLVVVPDTHSRHQGNDDYEVFYVQARFYTGLIAYPIVGLLGLLGSILCVVVMAQPQMTSSTNTYLMALAVSDMVKVVSDLMYFLVVLLVHFTPSLGARTYNLMYPYAHYVFNASMCISAWLTVSVSMERYIYVCHPTKVKAYCSVARARAISMSVYLTMSILAIPYAFRYQRIEAFDNTTMTVQHSLNVTDLWQNGYFVEIFTWTQFILRSVLPLVLLIILNCCIICSIKNCRLIGRAIGRRKHRITFMLFAVVVVFLVCTTPDAVMSSIFSVGYYEENYLRRGIREITDLLLLLNAAANFVLYCIFNTVFWQSFTLLFCRRCRPKGENSIILFRGRTGNVSQQRLSFLSPSPNNHNNYNNRNNNNHHNHNHYNNSNNNINNNGNNYNIGNNHNINENNDYNYNDDNNDNNYNNNHNNICNSNNDAINNNDEGERETGTYNTTTRTSIGTPCGSVVLCECGCTSSSRNNNISNVDSSRIGTASVCCKRREAVTV